MGNSPIFFIKIGLEWTKQTPSCPVVTETSFSTSKFYTNYIISQWYGAMICDWLKRNIGYKLIPSDWWHMLSNYVNTCLRVSSNGDSDCNVIIRKLLYSIFNTRWHPKINIWDILLNTRLFFCKLPIKVWHILFQTHYLHCNCGW
jgi:hypothetical protein